MLEDRDSSKGKLKRNRRAACTYFFDEGSSAGFYAFVVRPLLRCFLVRIIRLLGLMEPLGPICFLMLSTFVIYSAFHSSINQNLKQAL